MKKLKGALAWTFFLLLVAGYAACFLASVLSEPRSPSLPVLIDPRVRGR